MAKTYFEKLKDPRWQKKRLERLEKSHWSCDSCGDTHATLNVHHKAYFKGREPWEYEVDQLSALCEECHKEAHKQEDPLVLAASFVGIDGPFCRETVASLIAGFCLMPMARSQDPDSHLLGELVSVMPKPWSIGGKGLRFNELEKLIAAVNSNPAGFSDALRAFAGLQSEQKDGMDG